MPTFTIKQSPYYKYNRCYNVRYQGINISWYNENGETLDDCYKDSAEAIAQLANSEGFIPNPFEMRDGRLNEFIQLIPVSV